MKFETLLQTKVAASRLLFEIDELVKVAGVEALQEEAYDGQMFTRNPKQTGAIRRASMDLTRKLADLRQNR